MAKNTGKLFEDNFKASVPEDTYYVRLHDAAIGFDTKNSKQRFAPKSPYDAILCRAGQMYAIELKSHKEKRFSFGEKNADIKKRQVKNLTDAETAGAVAGVVLNFSDYEETYFIWATEFWNFMETCGKKSINLDDARKLGTLIPCKKKKVRYKYDLEVLLALSEKKSDKKKE